MKSDNQTLRKRGYASQEDIDAVCEYSQEKLLKLLSDTNPVIRTAAARCLCPCDIQAVQGLLSQLSTEKCLYTKIAVCETLTSGDARTAEFMTAFLGKIGNNQYRQPPEKVSAKKSFPLPRDIIARALGKMNPSILPILLSVLEKDDLGAISEDLDAIGFMVFYHPVLALESNLRQIHRTICAYRNNPLILWKCILCLSAFPLSSSINILEEFSASDTIFGKEARRSLDLIQARLGRAEHH